MCHFRSQVMNNSSAIIEPPLEEAHISVISVAEDEAGKEKTLALVDNRVTIEGTTIGDTDVDSLVASKVSKSLSVASKRVTTEGATIGYTHADSLVVTKVCRG